MSMQCTFVTKTPIIMYKKTTMKKTNFLLPLIYGWIIILSLSSCSSENTAAGKTETVTENQPSDKGIGPISKVTLSALDESLANTGKSVFENKCTACHKIDARHVGPALAGITKRRKPEWIMNMILNPTEMTQKDPVAKELLATYMSPMTNQNLTQDEARSILEFFRLNDGK